MTTVERSVGVEDDEVEVVLYSSATCGWAVRNYAALIDRGVPFRVLDVKAGDEHIVAGWRRASPYGKTPALRHGKTVVWESLVINDYLEETFPNATTVETAHDRSLARLWTWHCDRVLFPLVYDLAKAEDDAERLRLAEALTQSIQQMEHPAFDHGRLSPYWSGGRLGPVDIAFQVLFATLVRAPAWAQVPIQQPAWFAEWAATVGTHSTIIKAQALADDLHSRAA